MQKAILITGWTDGIGLATAEMLVVYERHVSLLQEYPGLRTATDEPLVWF